MRVIMTCGGTGGHINPAIAIANTIKDNDKDAEILFIGTKKGQESRLVPKENYEIKYVKSEGFDRDHKMYSPKNIRVLIRAVISPFTAKKIIKKFKPDIVIGTGGYACWPTLKAASMLGVPSMVHESNARPGMAVRRMQNSVDKILVNFEETKNGLDAKNKVIRVGNPIRTSFKNMDRVAERRALGIADDEFFVLSCGGSGGAEFFNNVIPEIMATKAHERKNVKIIHSTGVNRYKECLAVYKTLGGEDNANMTLVDYVYDMHRKMAAADLVICRAGAMTISEISMMGKTAIIIPSPNVTDNHQYENAKVLADAGAAILLEEKRLDADILWNEIKSLCDDPEKREKMSSKIRTFAKNDANKLIYEEIVKLVNNKGK